jgi:hypothetical protein
MKMKTVIWIGLACAAASVLAFAGCNGMLPGGEAKNTSQTSPTTMAPTATVPVTKPVTVPVTTATATPPSKDMEELVKSVNGLSRMVTTFIEDDKKDRLDRNKRLAEVQKRQFGVAIAEEPVKATPVSTTVATAPLPTVSPEVVALMTELTKVTTIFKDYTKESMKDSAEFNIQLKEIESRRYVCCNRSEMGVSPKKPRGRQQASDKAQGKTAKAPASDTCKVADGKTAPASATASAGVGADGKPFAKADVTGVAVATSSAKEQTQVTASAPTLGKFAGDKREIFPLAENSGPEICRLKSDGTARFKTDPGAGMIPRDTVIAISSNADPMKYPVAKYFSRNGEGEDCKAWRMRAANHFVWKPENVSKLN